MDIRARHPKTCTVAMQQFKVNNMELVGCVMSSNPFQAQIVFATRSYNRGPNKSHHHLRPYRQLGLAENRTNEPRGWSLNHNLDMFNFKFNQ